MILMFNFLFIACNTDKPAPGAQIDTEDPGTQIGTEDSLYCTMSSTETVNDLDEVPAGLMRSPREVIDSLIGAYAGPQMGEGEIPTSATVSLTVNDPGSVVTVTYYSGGEEGVDYAADPCPPQYTFELQFTMSADGFPSFDGILDASYTDDSDGNTWAETSDESLFSADLPAPVTFNPDDWDSVDPRLVFSGAYGYGWSATLSWEAYNSDDVVDGEDYFIQFEILFLAMLEAE